MPVTFSEQSTTTFPQPAAGGRMTFIDADGDGDMDILYQTGANGTAFQYGRSNGDGTYTILALSSSPFAGLSIPDHNGANFHVGDVDGDGDMDLYVGVNGATGSYFRNDNGSFSSQSTTTFPAPLAGSRMVMGDFDGDGDADMLYQTGGNGTAFQYAQSNGDGTYTLLAQASSPFAGVTLLDNSGGTHIAADFDGDGDLDLWNTQASTTGDYFRNDGGTFSAQSSATFPAPAAITRVVAGDFDSDGDADILYQTAGDGTAWQYARANGDGTMTILSQASSPFAGVTLVNHNGSNFIAGDIDGDGDDDLLGVTNGTQGEFYLANGKPPEITSSTPSDNATGVGATTTITITFDESVSKGSGDIYLYRGDGVLIETISVGSAQVTGSGTTWTIDPSVSLAGLTNYYILTDDGIFVDSDGSIFAGISVPTTLNFTTQATNTAPTFANLNGDLASFTEGNAVRLDVAGNATVADAEQANFNGGTLTVSITANEVAGQDVLSVANIGTGAGQISVAGAAISYQGVQIGTFTGGTAGTDLVITLDGDATPAATQALVRALQYNNTSDAPNTATRTITTVLTDGAGGTSATQTTTVSMTAVNDTPVNAVPGTQTVNEGASLTLSTANGNAISVADVDTTTLTVTLSAANGQLTLASTAGLSFSVGDGTADSTMTFTGAAAAINAALGAGLTYVPGEDFNGPDAISVVTNDEGAIGNDPGTSGGATNEEDQDAVVVNVVAVNDEPQGLDDDATIVEGGSHVFSAADFNFSDTDGGAFAGVVITTLPVGGAMQLLVAGVPTTLTAGAFVSAADIAAGNLRYAPTNPDASGAPFDTFTFQVRDDGGTANGGADTDQSPNTFTINITAANDPHTGGASVTGTATEDQVLTAVSTIADADGLGTLHYQWQRDTGGGFVNVGADQSTYTLTDADVGGVIRTVIYYTDAGGTVESATSASTAAIAAVNDPHTGGAAVTGTTTEDQVLTAVSTLADVDGLGTLHYQWQRDTGSGFVNVGADSVNYTLGDADVGGVVRVVISYTDGQGFAESATSAATGAIANVNDPHTGGAAITGTSTEDQVLTADSTLADADGLGTLHYQWQRDTGGGFVNVGADQATYTLSDADVGGVIRTVIYYTDAGGTVESATSAATGVIGAVNDAPTGGVSITGTATEDQVLTADTSTLADVDGLGTLHYDWQRDTGSGFVSIGAADQATYTLGDADVGGVVRVVVSYTDGWGTVESVTSAGTAAIANVDDAAVAVDDSDTVLESAVLNGSVVANDTDADGPAFVVTEVNGVAGDVGSQITLPSGALLTLNADGTYSYDPNDVFNDLSGPASGGTNLTATDSFTYTLANGNTATVTVTIVGEDSPGDSVEGDSGDNTLTAGDGEDTLVGGAGNDSLDGGDGEDTADYSGSSGGVHIRLSGGFGSDGEGGTDTLTSIENLIGSANNDILIGAAGGNLLSGGAGSDVLIGLDGDDLLIGGAGAANQLQGGQGDDTYFVEANDTVVELQNQGHDRIFTSRSSMTLVANVEELHFTGAGAFTGVGNDLDNIIVGGDGDDLLVGGAGDDVLSGGAGGSDTVSYAATGLAVFVNLAANIAASMLGTDTLVGIENVIGSSSGDVIAGDAFANRLSGGAGDDFLIGSAGNDTLQGGLGVDTVNYENAVSGVVVRLDLSTAQDGDGGVDSLSSIERVWGTAFNDLIIGNAEGNLLSGGDGSDVLIGRDGADTLIGGSGAANTLYGGAGDDLYVVSANDTIHELAGEGTDTVQTDRAYYALAANIENLEYTGSGDFAGVGNAANNVITGGDGRDTLTGRQGNDTLTGGAGHDTAVFTGLASQYTIENLGGGQYRVTDTVGGRDGVDILNGVEQLRFSDGVSVLGAPAAPLLSAKEAAQVIPVLEDDAFVLSKDLDLPQVLPDAFDPFEAAPALAGPGAPLLPLQMATIDHDGLPALFEDHGRDGADDWLY